MKDRPPDAELLGALSSLAAQDASAAPPEDLEPRLMAEFRAARRPRRIRRSWIPVAAAFVIVGAILLHQPNPSPRVKEPFYQIPYVVPPAPYERTEVRRAVLPLAALIAAGFEVHVADSGGYVTADVLVGQDGRALAIRLVAHSGSRDRQEN